MRLHKTIVSSFMAAAALLCSACGTAVSGGTSASGEGEPVVYRGSVVDTKPDGSIEVAQLDGHNYGQASIVFQIGEGTYIDAANGTPNQNAYVEVYYNGALTRSQPPQATAQEITVIAPQSGGVVQNGTVMGSEQTEDGWRVELLPFGAEDEWANYVVLSVPADALEGLTGEDLGTPGTQVSAVTRGIATMSLPPQMPVVKLLPYTE